MKHCPHCAEPLVAQHVCADNTRWTRAERDLWREIARRRYPSVQFVRAYPGVSRGRRS